MTPVSIVITTWNLLNPWHRRCIRRAREEVPAGEGEIIVIDQGSMDGTQWYLREALKEGLIDVLFLESDNRGASVSRNKGVAIAKHDYVLLLDGDIVMPRNWVNLAKNYLDNHPRHVAITITPLHYTDKEEHATKELDALRDVKEGNTSCTNLGLYRKSYLQAVPFPEHDVFGDAGWGFEDTYQSQEGQKKGYRWAIVEDRTVKYLHPLSSSRRWLRAFLGEEEAQARTDKRHQLLVARGVELRYAQH